MHSDPLENLARLRDRADSVAQQMDAARGAAAVWSGVDDSGTVTVQVEASGDVHDVRVRQGWREQIGLDGMADAVREALVHAGNARLRAWAEMFAEQYGGPEPRARPMPLPADTFAFQLDEMATAGLTGTRLRVALEELLAMAQTVEDGIDQMAERMRSQLDARHVGRSRSGHVIVTVTGSNDIAEIQYDMGWLARANERNIERETFEGLRAAYQQVSRRSATDVIAQGPLREIQALGQDPLGLARRLSLRDD